MGRIYSQLGKNDVTKSGYFQSPGREKKVLWTSKAWDQISAETIANDFNVGQILCKLQLLNLHRNQITF